LCKRNCESAIVKALVRTCHDPCGRVLLKIRLPRSIASHHVQLSNARLLGAVSLAEASYLTRVLGGERNSFNLLFRGPCEVCGGRCFSRLTDGRLIERLLSGRKPVGTFARRNHWQAWALDRLLQHRGLNTWRCTNRWGMHVAVACLQPDSMMAGGRVRDLAFRCAFVDELDPLCVRGALYGYPSCGLY